MSPLPKLDVGREWRQWLTQAGAVSPVEVAQYWFVDLLNLSLSAFAVGRSWRLSLFANLKPYQG
jgi:hypothetical protein